MTKPLAESENAGAEQELRDRVARAVARVDRLDAEKERTKTFEEERAMARERAAAAIKRPWWRLGR